MQADIVQATQHRHPYEDVRDTSLFYPLRKLMGVEREGEHPSLRKMSLKVLDRVIQGGAHDPVRASSSLLLHPPRMNHFRLHEDQPVGDSTGRRALIPVRYGKYVSAVNVKG